MRNHAKSYRFGGSWAGIETEEPERDAEPPIFTYDAWLGVSNFVVLATARFCNTLVIWLLQIHPVPRAIQNSSPSHVQYHDSKTQVGWFFVPAHLPVTCKGDL